MSDFRRLSDTVWASPQIDVADVAEAARRGFAMIVNNRPEGEEENQPAGDVIAAAAAEHGLAYVAIPIGRAGYGEPQLAAMAEALDSAEGKVLAYCRSGTRSTFLWSLTKARAGMDPERIAAAAEQAGYDLAPVAETLAILAAGAHD